MTNPSASWNTVTVSATYRKPDGTPKAGTVKFTIPVRVTAGVDAVIFPGGGSFSVTLDAYGAFSVALPATDDPDTTPNGWQYQVVEAFTDGTGGVQYYLTVPIALLSTGLNLDTIVDPTLFVSTTPALLRGVAGGVAALNSSGQVLDGSGAVVGGGSGLSGLGVFVDSSGIPYFDTSSSSGGSGITVDSFGIPYITV